MHRASSECEALAMALILKRSLLMHDFQCMLPRTVHVQDCGAMD